MDRHLPTIQARTWQLTTLRDSLLRCLANDGSAREVRLFFYAVTESGWREIRGRLNAWRLGSRARSIVAYIGTDHGLTEPRAMRLMAEDGVSVRLMQSYLGIYHPKVVWLVGPRKHLIWIGSNNLTRDGLLQNIEFAALLRSSTPPRQVERWAREVHAGSVPLDENLVDEYEAERRAYGERQAAIGAFTWSRRERPSRGALPRRSQLPRMRRTKLYRGRALVVEVMPRETGQDGKQIQLPLAAAATFFGITGQVSATRQITLTPSWTNDDRLLTMTVFRNHTVRLVINELEYNDRPCLLVFHRRRRSGTFVFDIVARSANPILYRRLLQQCGEPTRTGSRRWGLFRGTGSN